MLVMGKLPGGKTDRLHLISPCKTDMVVEAHKKAEGACKCEEYYPGDRVYYKLVKTTCRAEDIYPYDDPSVPINPDGSCPTTYTWMGHVYDDIKIEVNDISTHDGDLYFTCNPEEDIDQCIYDFMHESACVDDPSTDYDDCLILKYRDCYHDPTDWEYGQVDTDGSYPNGDYYCLKPDLCDADGNCLGLTDEDASVSLSNYQDTFALPINQRTNENTGEQETITVCENSWSSDFLGNFIGDTDKDKSCITVEYDEKSLRGYSASGFGPNYCGENKAQFRDKMATGCLWGSIAGSVGVSFLSGGTLTMVALPIAIGSGGVLCEKILNMQGKWPHSQY